MTTMENFINSTVHLYNHLMSKGVEAAEAGLPSSPCVLEFLRRVIKRSVSPHNRKFVPEKYFKKFPYFMKKNLLAFESCSRYVKLTQDPRSVEWPLMSSPFPMLSMIVSYLYFVKVLGPAWMKDRKPFEINKVIVAYNIAMVVLSAFFFFYGGSKTYLAGKYSWICEPVNYSTDPENMLLVRLGWWYLLLKIAEFSDTIFFVLRKKFNHISTLHVVHHSLVAWGVWVGLRFGPGGHNAFFPFINCFIHMIMYSYYCLAALGPGMRKYLWWKKYLTQFQMIQFVIALIHAAIPLFYDCGFQPVFVYILIFHAVLFLGMFYNFYRKAYTDGKNSVHHERLRNGSYNGHVVKSTYTNGNVARKLSEKAD